MNHRRDRRDGRERWVYDDSSPEGIQVDRPLRESYLTATQLRRAFLSISTKKVHNEGCVRATAFEHQKAFLTQSSPFNFGCLVHAVARFTQQDMTLKKTQSNTVWYWILNHCFAWHSRVASTNIATMSEGWIKVTEEEKERGRKERMAGRSLGFTLIQDI